jgi:hypothetical protein
MSLTLDAGSDAMYDTDMPSDVRITVAVARLLRDFLGGTRTHSGQCEEWLSLSSAERWPAEVDPSQKPVPKPHSARRVSRR